MCDITMLLTHLLLSDNPHAALESSNASLPSNSDANIRRSQVAKLKKNFMDSILRYQDVERTYQQKYRQRMERQIKIGKFACCLAKIC